LVFCRRWPDDKAKHHALPLGGEDAGTTCTQANTWSAPALDLGSRGGDFGLGDASTGRNVYLGRGNSGDPTNYNDAANWSPNTAVPGTADVAYFNAAAPNEPALTAGASLGELDFNTSGWQLGGGPSTLSLNGVGGIGILSAATSGINEISANLDVAAAQTWEVATGGTLQIDGVISDGNAADR
jgi:hypothetical protein